MCINILSSKRKTIIFLVPFIILLIASSCSGPAYPFDDAYYDSSDLSREYEEGRQELDAIRSDPCIEDIMAGVPEEYSRCDTSSNSYHDYELDDYSSSQSSSSCPNGCTTHIPGCDIKGNISFDTGERIYHVPGQEYYSETVINPDFGERWFCTEAEAQAAGWRRSFR